MLSSFFSLILSIRKVHLIHSNPAARLCLKLTHNSQIYELPTTYKVLKETQIPDIFILNLINLEGTIKLDVYLIFATKMSNMNEKLIGTYSMNLKEIMEEDGQIIKSEWELNDENTEKIYQPKLFLGFTIEKKDEVGISPTFNKNTMAFPLENPFGCLRNLNNNDINITNMGKNNQNTKNNKENNGENIEIEINKEERHSKQN